MELMQLIKTVREQGGGDLHLKIGSAPMMRRNKRLVRLDLPAVQESDMKALIEQGLPPEDRKKFDPSKTLERHCFAGQQGSYRLTLYPVHGRTTALIRLIRPVPASFDQLGIPPALLRLVQASQGLFILAGPARSGISTTMAALVEAINLQRGGHILIIEDPIEFFFEPKKARISHRQLNKDIRTIEAGINFAKRIANDVMVIGDIKKEVPYRHLLEYADGGHLVLLTMQTLGVQNTLEKISLAFGDNERDYGHTLLANNLIGACSQALLVEPGSGNMHPVHEILVTNKPIADILAKGKIGQIEPNIKVAGAGSILFDQSIGTLVKEGRLPKEVGEGFINMFRGLRG